MLKIEFSHEAASACCDVARRIIDRDGVDGQDGTRACRKGDLFFIRTNTGAIQVTYRGEVGLYAPLQGSTERATWRPGEWISAVDRVDRKMN